MGISTFFPYAWYCDIIVVINNKFGVGVEEMYAYIGLLARKGSRFHDGAVGSHGPGGVDQEVLLASIGVCI